GRGKGGKDVPPLRELRGVADGVRRGGRDDLARGRDRERDAEAGVAAAVGRRGRGPQVGLAFAVAGGVGGVVAEELDGERAGGEAVERPRDGGAAAGGDGRGQDGE